MSDYRLQIPDPEEYLCFICNPSLPKQKREAWARKMVRFGRQREFADYLVSAISNLTLPK